MSNRQETRQTGKQDETIESAAGGRMTILYVAHDKRAAEQAALSLRPAAPRVGVEWAGSFGSALRWIEGNRDLLTLIVEVDSDIPSCERFVSQVRAMNVTAPVIVVTAKDPAPTLATLKCAADEIVAKDPSFFRDLPNIFGRVVQRASPASRAARRALRVVYVGDAGLARECLARPGSIDVIEARPGFNRTLDRVPTDVLTGAPLDLDALFIEDGHPGVETHAILQDIAARKLYVPVVIVAEWDAQLAALAFKLGASDYVGKSKASLQAAVFRVGRLLAQAAQLRALTRADAAAQERQRQSSDEQLADMQAALRQAEHRLADERRAAEAKLAEVSEATYKSEQQREAVARREAALIGELGAAATARDDLERRVADVDAAHHRLESELFRQSAHVEVLERELVRAKLALQRAEQLYASDMSTAAARHDGLAKQLADAQSQSRQAEQLHTVDIAKTLKRAEERAAVDRQAVADEAAKRHVEIERRLATEVGRREALATQLKDLTAQAEAERRAAVEETARRQAAFDAALQQEVTQREASAKQHTVEMAAGAARLADQHRHAQTQLAEARAVASALEAKVADAVAALERAEQRAAVDRQTGADEASQRQAEFDRQLATEAGRRLALAKRLTDAETAYQQLAQRHKSETSDAAVRLTESDAKVAAWMEQADAERRAGEAVAKQLVEIQAAHRQAEQQHTADMAAAAALEAKLADALAVLKRVEERAAIDRHTAADEASRRQGEFDRQLATEVGRRQALAKQLSDAEAAHQQLEQRHESDARDAAARLADSEAKGRASVEETARRQAAFDIALREEVARGEALAKQLRDAEAARQQLEQRHKSDTRDAAARLADSEAKGRAAAEETARRQAAFDIALREEAARGEALAKRLAEAVAVGEALETRLGDAVAALERAEEHAAADRQTAADEASQRRAEFDAQLAAEVAARQALAKQHTVEIAAAAARLADHQHQADERLAEAVAVAEALEARLGDTVAALQRAEERAAVDRQTAADEALRRQEEFDRTLATESARRQSLAEGLSEAEAALQQAAQRHATLDRALADAADAAVRRQGEFDAALAQQTANQQALQNALLEAEAAHQRAKQQHASEMEAAAARLAEHRKDAQTQLTRAAEEAARREAKVEAALGAEAARREAERVKFEALVAERDRQLVDVEHRLHVALEAGRRDSQTIARLEEQLKTLATQLESTRRQREVLKTEADRVPQLRKEIEDIHAEHRRDFDHAPVNLCRCRPDGTISLVNQAFASFLGYRTPEELKKVDFSTNVFESADELQWIIERCLASHTTESVETTWTRKDGSRVVVRVVAVATTPDSIDMTAEDITTLRVLEEKLRIAQRMEAVARYASEVAVTCDNLLGHVEQEALHWLARIDSDAARYRGELLLEEVTRAAKYLRQLAVYGNEEKKVPTLVDMTRTLRDLEPVLKRVAGGDIDLVLPKAAEPLNLDVEAERVERILVNVAAYGRERMPLGGRLMFEVAPVTVDRKFVDKYPNVRPGAHVLLTINEVRAAARPNAVAPASKGPGVDLGALESLVCDCGGHLWMMAEPPGNMVLKIHLPRRVLDRSDLRPSAKAVRARRIDQSAGVRN